MKINRLYLKSFGKFKDKEITLTDGLNVVYGPNEAGKSTIQKFIEGMFFGFKKPFKSRRVFTNEIQAFHPWDDEKFQGILEYEHQGKHYQIERDFKNDEVAIRNLNTGEDITGTFKQHKGTKEYDFAESHMNINKNVFNNTISISQGKNVSDEELSQEISSKLTNLRYSGNAEISIRKACMELEKVLKEKVGSEKAPKSPLGIVSKQVEQLEEEKSKVEGILSKVRKFEAQLAEIRPIILQNLDKKRKKDEEIKKLSDYLQAKKLKSVREQEEKINKINEIIYQLEKYRYYPVQQKQRVVEIKEAVKNLESNLKEIDEALRKQKELRVQPMKYVKKHSYCQCLDMESAASISRDYALYKSFQEQIIQKQKLFETTENSLNDICRELEKDFWKNCSETDLYRAEKLEEDIRHLKNSPLKNKIDMLEEKKEIFNDEFKSLKNMLLLLLSLTGTILIPSFLFNSLFAMLLVLPAFLSVNYWKSWGQKNRDLFELEEELGMLINQDYEEQTKIENLEKELNDILKKNKVETSRDLQVKISQYGIMFSELEKLEREYKLTNREIKDLSNKYRELEKEITGLLKSASLWKEGEEISEKKIDEFKNRLSNYQSTANMLNNIDEKISELEISKERLEKEIYDLKEEAEFIFISAGVKSFEEYFQGCKKHREVEILLEQRQKYEEVLSAILEGTPIYELKKIDLSILKSEEITEEVNEELISKKQKQLEKINEELSKAKSSYSELETKIETTFNGFRPMPEIEEELSLRKKEKRNLQDQGTSLRAAIKMIEIVAKDIHRDFAPKLNEKVSEQISKITNNRYKQVKISKDLDITVMVPETGKHVSIHDLSSGTIDQFYFSARVMIADLVTGDSTLPLFLDDCFVQYDRKRLKEALKTLTGLSKNRQIILFTCHPREMDMLKEIKGKFKMINLEEPKLLFLDRLEKKTEKIK